jgi:hypothetical protein
LTLFGLFLRSLSVFYCFQLIGECGRKRLGEAALVGIVRFRVKKSVCELRDKENGVLHDDMIGSGCVLVSKGKARKRI